MNVRIPCLAIGLLLLGGCATTAPSSRSEPAAALAAAPRPVAIVDGVAISVRELDAHAKRTGLDRKAARDELVELLLLRRAAEAKQLTIAKELPAAEARAQLEHALARALSLDVPAAERVLVVDHAWVKDARSARDRGKQQKDLERLRARMEGGESIAAAFGALGVDGASWHIGEHETYGYDVVSAGAHDLPIGALSPVLAGDGGQHVFKILERKERLPPAEATRETLRIVLREGKTIELLDP